MSGTLVATSIEEWLLLVNDVNLVTTKVTEKDTAARKVRGWLEQSDHFVVNQKRRFFGLQQWTDNTGDESSSFRWYVGGGVTLSFTRAGRISAGDKYICTKDRIEIDDHIAGSGWQEQVWELQSKSAPVAGSFFEETVT